MIQWCCLNSLLQQLDTLIEIGCCFGCCILSVQLLCKTTQIDRSIVISRWSCEHSLLDLFLDCVLKHSHRDGRVRPMVDILTRPFIIKCCQQGKIKRMCISALLIMTVASDWSAQECQEQQPNQRPCIDAVPLIRRMLTIEYFPQIKCSLPFLNQGLFSLANSIV